MKQTFINFKDPINSYPLNERGMGVIVAGRYKGYNVFTKESNGIYKVTHTNNDTSSITSNDLLSEFSLKQINLKGKVNSNAETVLSYGVIVMPSGVIIHDTDEIRFPITDNVLQGNRYDLLVINHEYLNIQGGQQPIYEVIPGSEVDTLPTLPSLNKKVAIGVIEVPPGNATIVEPRYKPFSTPMLGDSTISSLLSLFAETLSVPQATESEAGIGKLASAALMENGNDHNTFVTPLMFTTTVAKTTRAGTVLLAKTNDYKTITADVPGVTTLKDLKANIGYLNNQVTRVTTSSYTLSASDNGKILYGALQVTQGFGNINLIVPNTLGDNFHVGLVHGTSNFTITPANGVNIIKKSGKQNSLNTQGSAALLNTMGAANEILFTGDLKNA